MKIVTASVRCDWCHATINYTGSSGVSMSDVLDIARRQYGWAIGREQRCLRCRLRPPAFHEFRKGERTPDPRAIFHESRCSVCGRFDFAAAEGGKPREPEHREGDVRRRAEQLTRLNVANWSKD